MKIIHGGTRIVVLKEDIAIKIGKIRPMRTFSKLLSLAFSKRRRDCFFAEYGEKFLLAAFRFLFVGIWINRNEFFYYQQHKDERVAPTIRMLFFGWIIIQERGLPVSKGELEHNHPLDQKIVKDRANDLEEHRQYCSYGDQIKVVDYGNKLTIEALLKSF